VWPQRANSGRNTGPDRFDCGSVPRLLGAAVLHRFDGSVHGVAVMGSHASASGETMTAGMDIGGYEQRPD
jgi:hypothetical protein